MRLDQDLEIWTQSLAHRPDIIDREILVLPVDIAAPGAGERVEFGGGEAHRLDFAGALDALLDRRAPGPAIGIDPDPLARSAAQEVVDRQPGALADDVPGGDLDRAPCRQQFHRAAADREILEHDLAGMADVEDRAADHMRRHRLDAFGDDGLLAGRDIGLAPAMGAVLGLDPAEQQVLRAVGAEDEVFDACDLHGGSPSVCEPLPQSPAVGYADQAYGSPCRLGESREPRSSSAKAISTLFCFPTTPIIEP